MWSESESCSDMSDSCWPHELVHGILQARILEWVAFPFSRGSSWSSNWTGVSYTAGGFFTNWAIREACGTTGKESVHNAGDLDSIPRLGRSPGEGNGYPLWYTGLDSSMDRIVHGVTKSQKWLRDFYFQEEEWPYVDSKDADICKPEETSQRELNQLGPWFCPYLV